jgi:hypothetical protein
MPNDHDGPPDAPPPAGEPPAERAQYTPAEQQAIRERYAAGGAPTCPRDGAVMTARPIGGGSFGLGYARRREWLMCPTCKRSALFDVKRGTRN